MKIFFIFEPFYFCLFFLDLSFFIPAVVTRLILTDEPYKYGWDITVFFPKPLAEIIINSE